MEINAGDKYQIPAGFLFPAVIKPTDMSGSTEVKKVESAEELKRELVRLSNKQLQDLDFVSAGQFIVEEYIPGKEFSVEGVVFKGKANVLSVTQKILSSEPYFVEFGHITGPVNDIDTENTIRTYAKNVIEAIGTNVGPFHLELRVKPCGTPVAIEVAARLPGDKIVELIKHSYSIDMAEVAIASYIGKSNTWTQSSAKVSAISFIPRGDKQIFSQLSAIEKYLNHAFFKKHETYFREGDYLGSGQDWTSRVGYFIFSGDDYSEISSMVAEVNEKVYLV